MKNIIALLAAFISFANINISSQWVNITPQGSDTTVYGVYTVNSNTAFICRGNKGTVLKTTNGGLNWVMVPNPSVQSINKIQFLNETTGLLGGNNALYKTTTSGNSWQTIFNTDGFADIFFLNESTGYLISINSPPKIYRTTNGGLNFSSKTIFNYSSYIGVSLSVTPQNVIYFLTYLPAADSSIVFKNTSWDSAFVPVLFTKPLCNDISFQNSNTGIICGYSGSLKRTSDGGQSWSSHSPGNSFIFQSVQMVNPNSAYVTGSGGSIFKSTNSGINWFPQNSQTPWYINDISVLPNDSNGFAVGDFGTIIKTSNGGITYTGNISTEIPGEFLLMQNYPNPFNPSTKIKFYLPADGVVSIKIFDIKGSLVNEIINADLQAGIHEISFNAANLSSGAYFYKIETKNFTDVKKMLLVK